MKWLPRLTLLLFVVGLLSSLSASMITMTFEGVPCLSTAAECSGAPGAATIDFDNLLNSGKGNSFTSGIATFSWTGPGDPIVQRSKVGWYAAPGLEANNPTPYLSVGSPDGPAAVTIALSSPITYFGMYIGSPDRYNSIKFYSGINEVGSYSCVELMEPPDGDGPGEGSWEKANYVNFSISDGTVDRIELSSSSAAFEMDNLAVATPEPTSLVTFCIGVVLLIGGRLKRR